jgi:hypothetical protein
MAVLLMEERRSTTCIAIKAKTACIPSDCSALGEKK